MTDELMVMDESFVTGLQKSLSLVDSGDDEFMKFTKHGYFVYGAEDMEVEERSVWVVNPLSLAMGFIAWPDGDDAGSEPMGELMSPAYGAPVLKSELEVLDGGKWSPQVAFQLACVSGEDVGTQALFKTSSMGGRKAFNLLVQKIIAQARTNPGQCVAEVMLEASSYKHKKYGKIYTPVFKVVGFNCGDGGAQKDKPLAEEKLPLPPEPEERVAQEPVGTADEEIQEQDTDAPDAPDAPVRRRRRR